MPLLLDFFRADDEPHSRPGLLFQEVEGAHIGLLENCWQESRKATGNVVERHYRIGGSAVHLLFAGEALVPVLSPAFAHLRTCSNREPGLTVCLWDSHSTGTAAPVWPRGASAGAFGADVASLFDGVGNRAYYWVNDWQAVPIYERGAPLRNIVHWWARGRGLQLVHGAAVGTAGGGALLAGPGGSGKSSSALACLRSAMLYAADDYVLIDPRREPALYSVYSSAKLHPHQLGRFPHLARQINNTERSRGEKALIFLTSCFPEKLGSGFPLRTILLPRVTGRRDTYIAPAPAASALTAVAPSTLFQLPGLRNQAFQAIADVVRRTPCFELHLGTELDQIPQVISELLASREAPVDSRHGGARWLNRLSA